MNRFYPSSFPLQCAISSRIRSIRMPRVYVCFTYFIVDFIRLPVLPFRKFIVKENNNIKYTRRQWLRFSFVIFNVKFYTFKTVKHIISIKRRRRADCQSSYYSYANRVDHTSFYLVSLWHLKVALRSNIIGDEFKARRCCCICNISSTVTMYC